MPATIETKPAQAWAGLALFVSKRLGPLLLFIVFGTLPAFAAVTITPTSWNVVGLDSNNPAIGPDTYQVGARVCNTGGSAVTSLAANLVWDSSNAFINLTGPATLNLASLNAGACTDFYFQVTVTRANAAYDTTRRYHITVSGTGFSAVSTPTPREIYVERLISQNRNSVASI